MNLERLAQSARTTLFTRLGRTGSQTGRSSLPGTTALRQHGATALFVLLWSSGAIVGKWSLVHASPMVFLTLRFLLACAVLAAIAAWRRRWLPEPGQRGRVAAVGVLLTGCYSICYLLALDRGVTPGVLATLLGAQPILTLLLTERGFSTRRLGGLVLALSGLVMVVYQSIGIAGTPVAGMLFALAALASMTVGAIVQKSIRQSPIDVMPLQYGIALAMCVALLPFEPIRYEPGLGLWAPLLWMALVISIGATLLLYRMIHGGNLVNVTSLFYLVPAGTAVLDFLLLGNRLPALALAGMATILLGLAMVFRGKAGA